MISRLVNVRMDAKRRVSLPSQLLDQVGIVAATRLVAHVEGPGRVVIETPEAAVASAAERIWADLSPEADAPLDLSAIRDADQRTSEQNIAARLNGQVASADADSNLLEVLGITAT